MAIFNQFDSKASHASNVAIVAAGSQFTGNLAIKCKLHIDGEFHGDIESSSAVLIGKTGVLQSKVRARKLVVAGKFYGEARCEAIELVSGGVVEGTLYTASLAIDKDASFEGKSVRKKLQPVADIPAKQKSPPAPPPPKGKDAPAATVVS
ncbi:MAG: polymer-forming cytoskeletal protein [Gammaproteobacteria bacterium]|nr:polymer-forming cytoskeletal protein [Gammaproteobacteria bacterium]MDA7962162.1 polymer-forming cytoskeletal protein [Gammaproteobacteria bacterium]MDA7968714.1 polymer-forming cytoskeletal protein [Gammaproteobacteria bacterium]MDA7970880.1 polymer-forming cytoskeletal protein [Gammaproteobacteria bacterium]MDA7990746.1 polymer-forming cytoskeletal protein [Gammaproteobacteria bacterium]